MSDGNCTEPFAKQSMLAHLEALDCEVLAARFSLSGMSSAQRFIGSVT